MSGRKYIFSRLLSSLKLPVGWLDFLAQNHSFFPALGVFSVLLSVPISFLIPAKKNIVSFAPLGVSFVFFFDSCLSFFEKA